MRVEAEIDLSAIRDNVASLKRRADVRDFMAVVKANAYGHGAVEVAKAAVEGGATWLGVATLEEGVYLTKMGLTAEILVLSEPEPTEDNIQALQDYELTPVVYSRNFIERLQPGMKVHLKVDTGMHRVGCDPTEAINLMDLILTRNLRLEGLMTHLAQSDNAALTNTQVDRFNNIAAEAPNGTLFHVANTGGVLYRLVNYDMVRCGLGIYGLIGHEFGLRPALKLTSRIASMSFRHQGTGMCYTQTRKQGDGYVGMIPVGYADGIPLRAANRGWIAIPGEDRQFPIVAVTMDMILVDFGRNVFEVGEPVELIGSNITVSDWARWLDTTPYEVVCGIGTRVPRNYVWKEEKS